MRCSWTVVLIFLTSLCLGMEQEEREKTPLTLLNEAKLLLDEQQHILAQERFLLAIAGLSKQNTYTEAREEKESFNSFVEEYESSFQSYDRTTELLNRVEKQLQDHPNYLSLLYFVAAAQANLGQLKEFFDTFFKAVSYRPSCFMAEKIIGVLHLRLSERLSDEAQRVQHRKSAIAFLKIAFQKEPQDISLLMKLAFIVPENEKRILLKEVCCDVLHHDRPMRREDCLYIIDLAISLSMYDEAKLLIDKAHTWYEYSRALNRMSEELEKRGKIGCD